MEKLLILSYELIKLTKRAEKFEFETAVSVGLGIIISLNAPALLLCSKAAFLYPTESNESRLRTRCGLFWQIEPVVFLPFPPHIF